MKRFRLILGILALAAGSIAPQAQPAIQPPPVASDTPAIGTETQPPRPKSPIDRFRSLLAVSPAQREKELAREPEAVRKNLIAKLAEYDALPRSEREARLRMTELRWQILPLMKTPPPQRGDRLAQLPLDERRLIEDRLREWDQLPADLQAKLLAHETIINYFVRIESTPPAQRNMVLEALPNESRQRIEQGLAQWQAMPVDERQKLYASFQRFFEMTPQEKKRLLLALPQTEQTEMQRTLTAFEKLSRQEREEYLGSFQKLAAMDSVERVHFLRGAERWLTLPADEREAWRELNAHLPPLPGGISRAGLPIPGTNETAPRPLLPGQAPATAGDIKKQ